MSKKQRAVVLLLCSLCLLSCASSKLNLSLDFPVPALQTAAHPAIVAVDEFVDLREQAFTSDTQKWVGFIPGVFWLDFESEIPDTYTGFSTYASGPFRLALSRAVCRALTGSGLFREVRFLPEDRYVSADYRLEGIIRRTSLKETGYYYGSGTYAWITRIIGLPYVSYEISLDIALRLRHLGTNQTIWTHDLRGSRTDKYNSIYQLNSGKDGRHILSYNIAKILEDQMPAALASMRKTLEKL